MNLIANENFPLETTLLLRNVGYDVLAIVADFSGISDEEVMELAIETKRLILTFDRDYGDLIFRKNMNQKRESFTHVLKKCRHLVNYLK